VLPLPVIAALTAVATLAGFVDAIAGGGGVLTVPALLMAGLPPHLALGTNKGCSTFGTTAAVYTFARGGRLALRETLLGFAGGCAGAVVGARLQLALPPATLRPVVLVLLGAVAVALALQRPQQALHKAEVARGAGAAFAIALALGAYDGFFGPGTGTFLIVAHVTLLGATLSAATAAAKPVNLGSNVASLVTFGLRHTVVWAVALPMAVGNVLGNALGARLALRRGDRLVRAMVILVSLALVVKLAIDLVRAR